MCESLTTGGKVYFISVVSSLDLGSVEWRAAMAEYQSVRMKCRTVVSFSSTVFFADIAVNYSLYPLATPD